MFHDLCGRYNAVFNVSSLDDRHKQYRRLLVKGLGAQALPGYIPLFESELSTLLDGLKASPSNLIEHIRRYVQNSDKCRISALTAASPDRPQRS